MWIYAEHPSQGSFQVGPSFGASCSGGGGAYGGGAPYGGAYGGSGGHEPTRTSVTVRYEIVKDRAGPAAPDEVTQLSDGTRYGSVEKADGVYEGDLDGDGRREGWGTLRYSWGDVYTGQFKAGKLCGYGEMRYANGNRHAGLWANDDKEGSGKFTDATGVVIHDGNWSKGAPAEYKIDTSISVLKATTRFKSLLRPKGAKLV